MVSTAIISKVFAFSKAILTIASPASIAAIYGASKAIVALSVSVGGLGLKVGKAHAKIMLFSTTLITALYAADRFWNDGKMLEGISEDVNKLLDTLKDAGSTAITAAYDATANVAQESFQALSDSFLKSIEDAVNKSKAITKQAQQTIEDTSNKKKKKDDEEQKSAQELGMEALDALSQKSKKAFQINKTLAISNAIMDSYSAFNSALGKIPPPFNYAGAAAALATGLATVSAIRSQQYQGRFFGGQVSPSTPYIVGEGGPEMFIPNQSGQIINNNETKHMMGNKTSISINVESGASFDNKVLQSIEDNLSSVAVMMNNESRRYA